MLRRKTQKRRGSIVVLAAVLMIVLVAMVAFAVDYGYLLGIQTDMQRAADAAALAAVRDLLPDEEGMQDAAAARATALSYTATNLGESTFNIVNSDIEIGRYNPSTIYSNVTLLNSGISDCVRVTIRRDGVANPLVSLFFARALGIQNAAVSASATAVLQKPAGLVPGAAILPFAVPKDEWDHLDIGDEWTVYGDSRIQDNSGNDVPGNWGTLDVGASGNSSSDINDQIIDGLRQSDLDALYDEGKIPSNTHIDAADTSWLSADTGLSIGIKHGVESVHGQTRLVPLYDMSNAGGVGGENLEYRVVGWGMVTVVGSHWQGAQNSYVTIRRSHGYDGRLTPNSDLRLPAQNIDGTFTSPVLVE